MRESVTSVRVAIRLFGLPRTDKKSTPPATKNVAITPADFLPWFDRSIRGTLVITFRVEMVQERANCIS